jgi:hypothetical protein
MQKPNISLNQVMIATPCPCVGKSWLGMIESGSARSVD